MKHVFRRPIMFGLMLCLASVLLLSFPFFEAGDSTKVAAEKTKKTKKTKEEDPAKDLKDALKKYEDAEKKLKEGKTKDAIKRFEEAIKKYSQPAEGYYPYLQLGLIYVQLGDFNTARNYCEQSQTFGAAPQKSINTCLAKIAKATQPEPTATPQPQQPTPQPQQLQPTPVPQTDAAPPAIAITSLIPETTQDAMLSITGVVTDAQGIADLTIQVRKPDTKTLVARPRAELVEKEFEAEVPLEIGENEILIHATDTAGQVGQRVFVVLRQPPEQPQPTSPRTAPSDAPPPAPQEVAAERGDVYAVVIGIGNFEDSRIPPLRFTANDAQAFYDALIDPNIGRIPEEHAKLLLNEEATDRNIKDAIGNWLRRHAQPDDTVLIYYSGHGAPEDDQTYWVTYNANIDNLYTSALSNNDVYDMLDRIEAKRIITFLDSCYSAATVNRTNRTKDIMSEIPWDKFSGEGQVTISASNGRQLSLEMQAYEHGVFTYYLLEGLKGKADGTAHESRDGVIEVEELWNYVRNQVSDTAKKMGNNQTPVLQGSLSAGIPIAFDVEYLQERKRKRQQERQQKQAALQSLFEQQQISAEHFDCAFQMLETGQSNGYLDGLLAGEISPATFEKLFRCE